MFPIMAQARAPTPTLPRLRGRESTAPPTVGGRGFPVRHSQYVRPDQLASEALQLINSSKITALIVVESDRPVGIVNFHDLLRAGVA